MGRSLLSIVMITIVIGTRRVKQIVVETWAYTMFSWRYLNPLPRFSLQIYIGTANSSISSG